MAFLENDARVSVGGGAYVDRLVCHPRLPLVAGRESERPAVHVWDCGSGRLREIAVIGADAGSYEGEYWKRSAQTPAVAWHPQEPKLLVTGEAGLRQWTLDGLSFLDGAPSGAAYRYVAFSPDGLTVWAFPSSGGVEPAWSSSDAIDVASGTLRRAHPWDTGVAVHPGGELVATLSSSQGATLGLFARADDGGVPARMRVFRRALVLDADGYETPVFSPDGRFMAVRGNAYENSLEVFEFPSLRRVLGTTLGEPNPGLFPYPPEWIEQRLSWSDDNIAFAKTSGTLLVGTPQGTVVEVDLDGHRAVEHDVLGGAPVSALAVVTTGDLVIASRTGELRVLPESGDRTSDATTSDRARDLAATFIAETSEIPDDADLETELVLTNGKTTWQPQDLATVTMAAETDPSWLQLQAFMNAARDNKA